MRRLLSESISNSEPNNSDSSTDIRHSAIGPRHSDFAGRKLSWWFPTKSTVVDEESATWTARIAQMAMKLKMLELFIIGLLVQSVREEKQDWV